MGVILCLSGFAGAAWLARRHLGDCLGLLLAVGSAYGLARAQLIGVFTHFWFDATLLGAYAGSAARITLPRTEEARTLQRWVLAICALPFVLVLLSPFFDPQPILVQLLGLRPAMFFVPLVLLGAAMDREEWLRFSRWAVGTAIATAALAVAELAFGVDRFVPPNAASRLIYQSQDVGVRGAFRIPSSFISSHAYAGTMLGVLPLLLLRLQASGRSKALTWLAIFAASFGVLITGARSPVVILLVLVAGGFARSLRHPRIAFGLAAIALALGLAVPRFEQFQRVETLQDPELVTDRIESSVNVSVLDALGDYPFGRGLAMAFGTSIPYFLADQARPQLGIENEYARIALEEGLPGLVLWVGFAVWVLARFPRRLDALGGLPELYMWLLCLASWVQGLIGVGMLAAVPGTLLLFTQMGALGIQRRVGHRVEPTTAMLARLT